jgi:hypothetical protein
MIGREGGDEACNVVWIARVNDIEIECGPQSAMEPCADTADDDVPNAATRQHPDQADEVEGHDR